MPSSPTQIRHRWMSSSFLGGNGIFDRGEGRDFRGNQSLSPDLQAQIIWRRPSGFYSQSGASKQQFRWLRRQNPRDCGGVAFSVPLQLFATQSTTNVSATCHFYSVLACQKGVSAIGTAMHHRTFHSPRSLETRNPISEFNRFLPTLHSTDGICRSSAIGTATVSKLSVSFVPRPANSCSAIPTRRARPTLDLSCSASAAICPSRATGMATALTPSASSAPRRRPSS